MSLFTRALAGAGEQAVVITNKYIDESLAQQRAQAIADIQRNSATQQREDADAFNNDPTRVARNRATAVADVEALEGAKNKVALAGRVAEASDPTITAGMSERAGKIAGATEKARVAAQTEATISQLSDPKYIDGLRKKAAAERDPNANAGSLATAALANFQLGQARKLGTIQQTLTDAIASGDKTAETLAREQLSALNGKDGKATEFYKAATQASQVISAALKIKADPNTLQDAREEADQTIREQRALINAAAARAGVDLSEAKYPKAPTGAIEMLRKRPDTPQERALYDEKFGPGAAQKVLGEAKPAAVPGAPVRSLDDQARDTNPGKEELQVLNKAKQALSLAKAEHYGATQRRQRDPQGVSAAQQALSAAQQAYDQAKDNYSAAVNPQQHNYPGNGYSVP